MKKYYQLLIAFVLVLSIFMNCITSIVILYQQKAIDAIHERNVQLSNDKENDAALIHQLEVSLYGPQN